MGSSRKQWRQIAWDGLTLEVPADWEPTVILRDYLLFESDSAPACEIKWRQGGASFAPDRILNRFRRTLGRDAAISGWALPDTWQQRCPSLTVSGFRLTQAGRQNVGILIFCPACRRTTLLRFYDEPERIAKTACHILASLADHSPEETQPWSIFDIRALLPTGTKPVSHEFLPGRFTLCFNWKGTTVTLYRFRPAAAILQKQGLAELGRSLGGRGHPFQEEENRILFADQAAGLERLRRRLRRQPSHHWFRLRRLMGHNVILGVKGEGTVLDTDLLERIWSGFTITTNQQERS